MFVFGTSPFPVNELLIQEIDYFDGFCEIGVEGDEEGGEGEAAGDDDQQGVDGGV